MPPALAQEATGAAATEERSTTRTCLPCRARWYAIELPMTPPPTISTSVVNAISLRPFQIAAYAHDPCFSIAAHFSPIIMHVRHGLILIMLGKMEASAILKWSTPWLLARITFGVIENP